MNAPATYSHRANFNPAESATLGRRTARASRFILVHQPAASPTPSGLPTPARSRPQTVDLNLRPASPHGGAASEPQRAEWSDVRVAKLAHDLNNALSPLVMMFALLRLKISDPSSVTMIETIQASLDRAAEMTQALAPVRGTAFHRHSAELRGIVEEVFALTSQSFPSTIAIEMEAPAELQLLNVCPTSLHRALFNLCINARDAMPTGGKLTLRATSVENENEAGASASRRYVLFEITDTGTGIPQSMWAKIFDPFFTTKEEGKGTGLGLASVRDFVASHGGKLSIQSEIGLGTTFRIFLPAA